MEALEQSAPVRRSLGLVTPLASLILILVLLYLGRLFFITLFSSIMLAFILDPMVAFFMRFRLPRGAASFVACALLLVSLYLAGLGLWTQGVGFLGDLPTYTRRISDLVDSASQRLEEVERSAQDVLVPRRMREQQVAQQALAAAAARGKVRRRAADAPAAPPPIQEVRIKQDDPPLFNSLYNYLREFSDVLLMTSFVPFLIYFSLSWHDHLRRSALSMADGEGREMLERAWEGIANVARAYVVGNFLLGVLISVAASIFFWFSKIPYWQMAGPLSGFLTLVPYLGLPLSLIPPFVAMLPVYSGWTAYLLVGTTVSLFHLLALNLLYPKLVGARVHLNPLTVTVALMIWYLIWGGAGLVLAIPITASIKAVLDNIPRLRGYGRLMGN